MEAPTPLRLSGIEAVRGAAATMVVLYHGARHLDKTVGAPWLAHATQFGHAGVDLFFTVSGFIILFVHRGDIDRPSRLFHYVARRSSRIMPIYWLALALAVTLNVAAGHAPPPLARLLWSLTLLPSADEPVLDVAWTLQYEIVFYAIFAVLTLNRRAGLAILMGWLAWVLATWLGPRYGAALPGSLSGLYNLEFFLGMAAAWLLTCRPIAMPRAWLASGVALFAVMAGAENAGILDGYGPSARLACGLPSAAIIIGIVAAERAGQLRIPAWLRALGGGSYSIYLFQFIFIGIAWQLCLAAGLDRWTGIWASYLLLIGAALAGGVAMTSTIERPLLRVTRGFPVNHRTRAYRANPTA